MKEPFSNKLSAARAERIAYLMEECSEIIYVCAKILRHGMDSCSPLDPNARPNFSLLEEELADLRHAVHLSVEAGDVREAAISHWRKAKGLSKYLHHQDDVG